MKKLDIIQVNSVIQQVNLSALSVDARKEILLLSTELSPIVKAFNEAKQDTQDKLFKDLDLEDYVKDNSNPKFLKERNAEKEFNDIVTEMLQEEVTITKTLSEDTIYELPASLKNCNLSLINYLNELFK